MATNDAHRDLPPSARIFLYPGELCVTREPTIVSTVLGSCVSVTMFHPRLKVGAMCHAMLPENGASSASEAFRFVDHAMLHMLEEFTRLGVRHDEIEVKLFGGSDVIAALSAAATIGEQNVEKALEIIDKERLRLFARDVRGEQGRKIFFHTHTGGVLLKRIKKQHYIDN
jgi:chemotaxis protein CheD